MQYPKGINLDTLISNLEPNAVDPYPYTPFIFGL